MINTMFNREHVNSPNYDQGLLWVILVMLGLGLVMVYSASIAIAEAAQACAQHVGQRHVERGARP